VLHFAELVEKCTAALVRWRERIALYGDSEDDSTWQAVEASTLVLRIGCELGLWAREYPHDTLIDLQAEVQSSKVVCHNDLREAFNLAGEHAILLFSDLRRIVVGLREDGIGGEWPVDDHCPIPDPNRIEQLRNVNERLRRVLAATSPKPRWERQTQTLYYGETSTFLGPKPSKLGYEVLDALELGGWEKRTPSPILGKKQRCNTMGNLRLKLRRADAPIEITGDEAGFLTWYASNKGSR
jgi:hypothetical protein